MVASSDVDVLARRLHDAPLQHSYDYTEEARLSLLRELFNALACGKREYLNYFFQHGPPNGIGDSPDAWNLSAAQGAVEGAEYSEAARGNPCGHILKSGEATYRCKYVFFPHVLRWVWLSDGNSRTCSLDETCVLCAKCFEASDHTGHVVHVSITPGNSGCCDCGDAEAWRTPVKCAIHTPLAGGRSCHMGTEDNPELPKDLIVGIRSTIAKAIDYLCDVISCSPEQLRLPKTKETIRKDEEQSRLTNRYNEGESYEDELKYSLVLWNDEKHTIDDVKQQVARACKKTTKFSKKRAQEAEFIGRSIIISSDSIEELLRISTIIEQIKITVTIRSARDTFREQMCGTIIEWLGDIAGCSVGGDNNILRTVICEELLGVWRVGSLASNTEIGKKGLDDHALSEDEGNKAQGRMIIGGLPMEVVIAAEADDMDVDGEGEGMEGDEDDDDDDGDDVNMVGIGGSRGLGGESEDDTPNAQTEEEVPPGQPVDTTDEPGDEMNEDDEDEYELSSGMPKIPHTPGTQHFRRPGPPAPQHWLETPSGYTARHPLPPHEDLRQRVRLDWLILFDLRLWKKARVDLRDLYISTVVAIPEFKRILGLRFAGLYTILSQLYLIPDREPDHSIINLSLQILTTPSITAEVVCRGNFLTNLMAILYTFLTTRQVGHPHEVNKEATLALDTGSLTNRRMYHFFTDMRYLLGSPYVQERLRREERYLLQFLDLARLHQGICPNVRAVGEHVEYEADAWITAALVTREINKLTRQFPKAFQYDDLYSLQRAIATVAKYAIVSSMGWERYRFHQTEIKSDTQFRQLGGFEFDTDQRGNHCYYQIVRFAVDKQPISFHHALHYTLSWLVENGKAMNVSQLQRLLMLDWDHVKHDVGQDTQEFKPQDLAIAMFDYPLRVCVWLAQMKAGMWVRNGFSLRHQMQTYKNVSQRDLTHHRDIFLLQTALVTINPSRMLLTMIDRFNLFRWMEGNYHTPETYEEMQVLDLAEDFLHLLIILLSDRLPLIPLQEEPDLEILKLKREIVHILCFKPIQFSELCNRLPERLHDHERFQDVLSEMATYRPPDGLSDSGTFELKDEFQSEVDPYIMQFSKNQREETESNYCARIAKKTGVPQTDVVFEPRLRQIHTGVFADIAAFTRTPIFAQVIYYSLAYALHFKSFTPGIPESRVETFLQVCLHLCQLAVAEDMSIEGCEENDSFILHALEKKGRGVFWLPNEDLVEMPANENGSRTIVTALHRLSGMESFKACHPKIGNVLRRMRQKKAAAFDTAGGWVHEMGETMDSEVEQTSKAAEVVRKKLLAKERQAKIMAQMKQQQQNFLNSTGYDFGEDDFSGSEDDEFMETEEEQRKWWKYPSGTCILCQEEMNDSRLYGTLALVTDTNVLRQTPMADFEYIYEVAKTPDSLDRPADEIRPFGVASMNRDSVKKMASDGSEVIVRRQGLGKGFPPKCVRRGPVAVGCSHVMHFSCFEHYYESTRRRHPHQIARAHPERLEFKEFVCPLCKALGNTFLPIIWKSKEETLTGVLQPTEKFEVWLGEQIGPMLSRLEKVVESGDRQNTNSAVRSQELFSAYGATSMIQPIGTKLHHLATMNIDLKVPDMTGRASPSYSFGLLHEVLPRLPVVIPSVPQTEVDELHKIYRRLRNTLISNKIYSTFDPDRLNTVPSGASLTHCDSLARILGYSISAVEIAQRGVGSDPGSTLLDKISQQVLTHLRILSETIFSYFSVGGLQNKENNQTIYQFKELQKTQMQQLFVGHPQICDDTTRRRVITTGEALLATDLFVFLAECSVCLVPALNLDVIHVIRLCYVAEIVKAIVVIQGLILEKHIQRWGPRKVESLGDLNEGQVPCTDQQLNTFRKFVNLIGHSYGRSWSGDLSSDSFPLATFRTFVTKYTTPFLRKSAILLHTHYGILFPNTGFEDLFDTEASRLSKVMGLPDLDEIFASCLGETQDCKFMRAMISGWCRHSALRDVDLKLSHPSIFELVGLPLHFDTLVEEAMKRRCPSTGKDLTEPTVCLFCGEVFCSQAFCCTENNQGGCNQHLQK